MKALVDAGSSPRHSHETDRKYNRDSFHAVRLLTKLSRYKGPEFLEAVEPEES